MDIELLKVWQKGLRDSRDEVMKRSESGGVSFKDKLNGIVRRAAKKPQEEESGFSVLPDLRRRREQQLFWQKRWEQRRIKHKRLAKEEEALATQRIRMIKALNFARARYGK